MCDVDYSLTDWMFKGKKTHQKLVIIFKNSLKIIKSRQIQPQVRISKAFVYGISVVLVA